MPISRKAGCSRLRILMFEFNMTFAPLRAKNPKKPPITSVGKCDQIKTDASPFSSALRAGFYVTSRLSRHPWTSFKRLSPVSRRRISQGSRRCLFGLRNVCSPHFSANPHLSLSPSAEERGLTHGGLKECHVAS